MTTIKCPNCGAALETDATLIGIRRHLLDHRMGSTLEDAMALVRAQSVEARAPEATPSPVSASTPAVMATPGIKPLAGKVVAVAGSFHPYDPDRVDAILVAAGAKTTDRRGLNRAAYLLAGSRIGAVLETAQGMGLEVKDLAWLQEIEALVEAPAAPASAAPVAPAPAPLGVSVALPASAVVPVPPVSVSGPVATPARPSVSVPNALKALVIPHDGNPRIPVPTGKYEWAGLDRFLAPLVQCGERIALVGPPGCGKSAAIVELAGLTNHPLVRVNLDGQTNTQDLLGKGGASNGSTHFEYGAVPIAAKNGWWLLIDEIDGAEADILTCLHGVTEENGILVLKEANGEVIIPHPDFRIFATGNSLGLHDENGMMTHAKAMSPAFLDRWIIKLMGDYSESKEAKILAGRGIPLDIAKMVCGAGTKVRKLIETGAITGYWTTRKTILFAKYAVQTGSYEEAFAIAAEGKFSAPEFKAAWEVAQRETGKTVITASSPASTSKAATASAA